MKQFGKALLLAVAVLAAWTSVIMIASPVHQLVFTFVPPDGTISAQERMKLDQEMSRYLFRGNVGRDLLKDREQRHMAEVRQIWLTVTILAAGSLFFASRTGALRVARLVQVLVLVKGVVSLILFPSAFLLLHMVLFRNNDWILPPEEGYVLTVAYPVPFFAASWAFITVASLSTLEILRRQKRS